MKKTFICGQLKHRGSQSRFVKGVKKPKRRFSIETFMHDQVYTKTLAKSERIHCCEVTDILSCGAFSDCILGEMATITILDV